MSGSSLRPRSIFILIYLLTSIPRTATHTPEHEPSRIHQKILVGPHDIVTHPGGTVQFPCIVSKESDAIVTWCWNDFCTLGKAQFLRHETSSDGPISIYQYAAYPRFQLFINERLNHFNLSMTNVSSKDEGNVQCQVQRTMRAHEARSDRVHLTLIAPPDGQATLILPTLPLKQGHAANLTCFSSPSKPASVLMLYRNEQLLTTASMFYELETTSNRNRTTLTYTIDDPDSSWDEALIRCEQIYTFAKNSHQAVTARLHVHSLMSADSNEYKPRVRIESQNRHPLTINATATFRCIVHGNPEPQFRWFANSMDLTALTSPIINIPLSKHVHNHSIGCSATNSIGTTNTSIRLLIRYPPVLFVRPPKFVVIDLERKPLNPAVVRCIVDSYPRARITWYHYGELLVEGASFPLGNITKREQQGIYSYRIETDGFETVTHDFIIFIKGKPLVFVEESKEDHRLFECRVYSSTPILRITWKFNDQSIESNDRSSISTVCNDYSCISKLVHDHRKLISTANTLSRLSCIAENQFGTEQSRLYQIDSSDDISVVLISLIMGTFVLIILFSIVAIYCCCRTRQIRKRHERSTKAKLPLVFDEHYSINELIKEVGSLRTCNTSSAGTDRVSLKLEPTDRLLTNLFNSNTKRLLDNLSNESSTNSSGFHSKSTTTIFNNDYTSPTVDLNFSGLPPLYTPHYQMNV